MSEVLKPNSLGISGLLELARMVTPPDHETIGFEDSEGNFFSLQQLKAIEWQERHQMENQSSIKVPESLRQLMGDASIPLEKLKFIRQVRKVFHFGDSFIAVANDDTVWYLRRMDKNTGADFWEQLHDASTPALPQGEEIA